VKHTDFEEPKQTSILFALVKARTCHVVHYRRKLIVASSSIEMHFTADTE